MIEARGLRIRLGEFRLRGVDLTVAEGEYFVLLGPTGAGKTVLLECLAGLHRPQAGTVRLDGIDVTAAPPERRGIAYVPQDYALFPNLTARRNIAYGLEGRRPKAEIEARVGELADWLSVRPLLDRKPLTLSGGEKQRVALARALAVRPRLLLLDEPLAAVDPATRDGVLAELKRLQRRGPVTVIHVCHSFEEALAVADRIGVMNDGRIVQTGPAREIFRRPASAFVAGFTGAANLLEAEWSGGEAVAEGLRFPAPGRAAGRGVLVIRPEDVEVRPGAIESEPDPAGRTHVNGVVTAVDDRGPYVRIEVEAAGRTFVAAAGVREAGGLGLAPGSSAEVRLPHDRIVFIEDPGSSAETEKP